MRADYQMLTSVSSVSARAVVVVKTLAMALSTNHLAPYLCILHEEQLVCRIVGQSRQLNGMLFAVLTTESVSCPRLLKSCEVTNVLFESLVSVQLSV